MKQYIDLVREVLAYGDKKPSRTGDETLSLFGAEFSFKYEGKFPLLTTKRMNFQNIVAELIWFLSGENNTHNLEKHTDIWKPWTNEFSEIDSCYGYFWRRFPSIGSGMPSLGKSELEKDILGVLAECSGKNFDQIKAVIESIKNNPDSRRHLVSAVSPENFHRSNIPPCHFAFCFYHHNNDLSLHVFMRSTDVAIGLPYNIASYFLLLMLVCQETGMYPKQLKISMTDCHIYKSHIQALHRQIEREPFDLPYVVLPKKSMLDLSWDDIDSFKLMTYNSHEPVKYKVYA